MPVVAPTYKELANAVARWYTSTLTLKPKVQRLVDADNRTHRELIAAESELEVLAVRLAINIVNSPAYAEEDAKRKAEGRPSQWHEFMVLNTPAHIPTSAIPNEKPDFDTSFRVTHGDAHVAMELTPEQAKAQEELWTQLDQARTKHKPYKPAEEGEPDATSPTTVDASE